MFSTFHNFKFTIFKNKHIKHIANSNYCFFKFSNYTARLPFWSTKKTWCCDTTNFIWKIRGNPLPESCAMLFTTLCTGWSLEKRTIKLVFLQHSSKSKIFENWGNNPYIFPPYLPINRPLKAAIYVNFVHNHTFSARPGSAPLGSARPGLARLGSARLAPARTCSTTPAHVHNTKNVHTPRRYRRSEGFPWTGIFRPCVRWVREVGRFRALLTYPRVRISVFLQKSMVSCKRGTQFSKKQKNIRNIPPDPSLPSP